MAKLLQIIFSDSTFDPGQIDSPIAGFFASDGLGVVSPNNTVNPIFTGWATVFIACSAMLKPLQTVSINGESSFDYLLRNVSQKRKYRNYL